MITTKLHPALNTPIDDNIDGIQVNHNKLLADLVECNFPLIGIARQHGLTLAQLIAWAAQPAVRALLDAADELAARIADHKAKQGRNAAVQTLLGHATGLCESPRDRDLANRAARTLVRITAAEKPRTPRKPGSDSPSLREGVGERVPTAPDANSIRKSQPTEPVDPTEVLERPATTLPSSSLPTTTINKNGHQNGHKNGLPAPP